GRRGVEVAQGRIAREQRKVGARRERPDVHAFGACAGPAAASPSAERRACHASVAHFTRNGNRDTPENAFSLPRSSPPPWPVTSPWNESKSFSASARVLPFTACVMRLALALEIAQPEPWNETSSTTSPFIFSHTLNWSPHIGFTPSACALASGIARKFCGRRLWSRMMLW